MKTRRLHTLLVLVLLFSSVSALGRTATNRKSQTTAASVPLAYCLAGHNVGRIALSISNNGTIGNNFSASGAHDCFTGELLPNLEYPKGSGDQYLFGAALWIGGIVGSDTLVSVGQDGWQQGAEFNPDQAPLGVMQFRSTTDPNSPSADGAVSEQDYIGVYYDTCTSCAGLVLDWFTGQPHTPLNLKVTQRSFGWSVPLAEDFVIIEYTVKNIGNTTISKTNLGIYVDSDVHDGRNTGTGFQDDLTGFRREVNAAYMPLNCPAVDTLDIAYIIDNDGDFENPPWDTVPHVTGMRMLDIPAGASKTSYNWWSSSGNPILDFGPQGKATFRDFSTGGTGTPEGDRGKYHVLGNGEIDYDQVFTASITSADSTWFFPNPILSKSVSIGIDTKYLLSTGSFNLAPGQEATVAFAYVAGEDIHVVPDNWRLNLNDSYSPMQYNAGLDFTDLDLNATWAGWVYDNPGVDTDSDGYAGEFRVCDNDTVWYKGDGVPDLRATFPPEAPDFWVDPKPKSLYVRWNGRTSEETRDAFSRQFDFEGYHAFLATTNTEASFALVGSYDIDDYNRMVWDNSVSDYRVIAPVQTLEQTRCLYAPGGCNDQSWHPEDFTRSNPYRLAGSDSIFYFIKEGPNMSALGFETPFKKRFPDAPKPPANWTVDSVSVDRTNIYLTDDNFFKYFEYEFTIGNLIPGKQYWVAMTSFDNGSKIVSATGNESPKSSNAKSGIPLESSVCCVGFTGNIDCDPNSVIDITDLTVLINHLFIGLQPLCCKEAGNIDGDSAGEVTITDLTVLIDHLFINFTPTAACQ